MAYGDVFITIVLKCEFKYHCSIVDKIVTREKVRVYKKWVLRWYPYEELRMQVITVSLYLTLLM